MVKQRKNYSQEFKLKAVNLITEQGKPATACYCLLLKWREASELMRATYAVGFENTTLRKNCHFPERVNSR